MSIVITQRPPAPVPPLVTALQARRALRSVGLTAAVDAYLDSDPTGALREDWEFATELPRGDAMIEEARVALQLSADQMDDLFRLAATL